MENFDWQMFEAVLAAASVSLGLAIFFISLVTGIIASLMIVANAKIYEKAGYSCWKSVIPIYKDYILFSFTWGSGWFFLLELIPFVNIVVSLMTRIKLAKVFGGNTVVIILLIILFPIVGFPLIAFSDGAQYVGDFAGDDA